MFRPRKLALVLLAPAVLAALCADARGLQTQRYRVTGSDSFQIGSRQLRSTIAYAGSETLTIARADDVVRYTAKAGYTRTDQGESTQRTATFVAVILPSGRERDQAAADPDFLTVLNQPFAVQLDQQTLRDVRKLKEASPFSFTSSMTGAALHGTLFHVGDGTIAGHPVVGIGFDASGPMRGAIPEHPEISLKGTIRMTGRAYYTSATALLLGLEATLRIAGTLADQSTSDRVLILYRRSIRAR